MLGPVKEMARLVGRLAAEETQPTTVDTSLVPDTSRRRSAAAKLERLIDATFVMFPADERSSYGNFEFVPDNPDARADLLSAYMKSGQEGRRWLARRVADHALGGSNLTIVCESSSSREIYEVDWFMLQNSSEDVVLISIEFAHYEGPALCIKVCTSCASDRRTDQPLRYKRMFRRVFERITKLAKDEWTDCTPSQLCLRILEFCRFLDGIEGRSVVLFDRYFAFEMMGALKEGLTKGESIAKVISSDLGLFFYWFQPLKNELEQYHELHAEALKWQRLESGELSNRVPKWLNDTHKIVGSPLFFMTNTLKYNAVNVCLCEFMHGDDISERVLVVSIQRHLPKVPPAVVGKINDLIRMVIPHEQDIKAFFSTRSPSRVFKDKHHFANFMARARFVDGCVFGCKKTSSFVREYRSFDREERKLFAENIVAIRTWAAPVVQLVQKRESGDSHIPEVYCIDEKRSYICTDLTTELFDRFVFATTRDRILVVLVRFEDERFRVDTIAYDNMFKSVGHVMIRDTLLQGIKWVNCFCWSFQNAVTVLCDLLDGVRECYDFNLGDPRYKVCGLINDCIKVRYEQVWTFGASVNIGIDCQLTTNTCPVTPTATEALIRLHTDNGAFNEHLMLSGWGERKRIVFGENVPVSFKGGYSLYLVKMRESHRILCLYQRIIRSRARFYDELRRISVVPVPDNLLESITFEV